ncbi:hypothetical protein JYK22_31060, partial [Nonomuraea sp. RK-328]|nr:hypothetical protein [Nonomuraea sp. RK-328]
MPHDRTAIVTGLRRLADFLDAHPDIPVSATAPLYHFTRGGSDADQRAEIDQIAVRLGSPVEDETEYGHYTTAISFGPIEYRAIAITAEARARHAAAASYHGCVQPDPTPAT